MQGKLTIRGVEITAPEVTSIVDILGDVAV